MSDGAIDSDRPGAFSPDSQWRQRYTLLLEAIPDPAFAQDASGRLIGANAAATLILGFQRGELLAKNIRELLAPESYRNLVSAVESAVPGAEPVSIRAHLISRAGERIPVELRASFLREPDGPLTAHYVARDASRHETRFRLMANNLTEMVLAYDMDRRLTFANTATETLTGYSLAQLERDQFICWVHAEDRDRMLRISNGRARRPHEVDCGVLGADPG